MLPSMGDAVAVTIEIAEQEQRDVGVLAPTQAVPEPSDIDFTPLGTECTPIEGAQNRAMFLPQLRRLRDFLLSHANLEEDCGSSCCWACSTHGAMQWVDRADPQYSPTSGQALNVHTINLYQVHVHCDADL